MILNLQIALEFLLHFIVIQWIYEKTSLVRIPRMILPIAFLVECIGGILGMSYNVGLSFMTPFYLLFYAYFYGKERTTNMLAFYAFYPLVLYLLIFNGYAYFLMPGFGITSDFLNKSYLYFIFFDLLIIPTFVALSKLLILILNIWGSWNEIANLVGLCSSLTLFWLVMWFWTIP